MYDSGAPSVQGQIMIFLMGCFMTTACIWSFFVPFVKANPQVVTPMIAGGFLGFLLGSTPLVAAAKPSDVWGFCFTVGIAPCIGLFLGAMVGLAMKSG